MIVLDTDVLTLVQRGEGLPYQRLVARLEEVPDDPVCVTIVSFEEQMRGWLAWIADTRKPERQVQAYGHLRALLADFQTRPVLDFSEAALAELQRLKRAKVRVGTMDLKIAAIVLVNDATLVSRNLKDYRKVPGLRVDDWTAEARDRP